jgi:hypothetical protein
MSNTSHDVHDFLADLSAAGVRFVVVGAYALAAHGRVRATGDIDILIAPNLTNAKKVQRAIRSFADTSLEYFGVTVDELARPRIGFYMGVEPNRIDVLTKIAGLSFERAWSGRIRTEIEGVEVSALGYVELLAAKRASVERREPGSFKAMQDEADLQWLLAHRPARPRSRR